MKRAIKYLLLADMWASLALGMIGPIYAVFVAQIGGDLLDAGWAYFAFMMSTAIAIYLFGRLEDKFKHKEIFITSGYVLTAIGCLSYYFVYNQTSLIITQIILGLAIAILNPAYDAIYTQHINKKKSASEWANLESMIYAAEAVAAIIGSFIATKYGFKNLFLFMFGISLLSILFSFKLYKNKKHLNK